MHNNESNLPKDWILTAVVQVAHEYLIAWSCIAVCILSEWHRLAVMSSTYRDHAVQDVEHDQCIMAMGMGDDHSILTYQTQWLADATRDAAQAEDSHQAFHDTQRCSRCAHKGHNFAILPHLIGIQALQEYEQAGGTDCERIFSSSICSISRAGC